MMNSKKSRGYWNNFDNVQRELHQFITVHGSFGVMPTFSELQALGYNSLCNAIQRHGGLCVVADRLGLTPHYKSRGYWDDFRNIEKELCGFIAERSIEGCMPTVGELHRGGAYSLAIAINKHGGFSVVAEKLGLKPCYKIKGYWDDLDNIEKEVCDFMLEHGTPGYMPTVIQLSIAGYHPLVTAIYKHGGFPVVAEKLGLIHQNAAIVPGYRLDSTLQKVYEFA